MFLTHCFATVAACLLVVAANSQTQQPAATQESGVVLTKLLAPTYPPLARQARITGDVKIRVGIRPDGSVASAEVISGHAMLKQSTLESVQKSTFGCEKCTDAVTFHTLTYTFGLRDDVDCGVRYLRAAKCLYLWKCGGWRNAESHTPAVANSPGHVIIIVDSACLETETTS